MFLGERQGVSAGAGGWLAGKESVRDLRRTKAKGSKSKPFARLWELAPEPDPPEADGIYLEIGRWAVPCARGSTGGEVSRMPGRTSLRRGFDRHADPPEADRGPKGAGKSLRGINLGDLLNLRAKWGRFGPIWLKCLDN